MGDTQPLYGFIAPEGLTYRGAKTNRNGGTSTPNADAATPLGGISAPGVSDTSNFLEHEHRPRDVTRSKDGLIETSLRGVLLQLRGEKCFHSRKLAA